MPHSAESATTWSNPKEILCQSHPNKLKKRSTSSAERQQWSELRVGALASIVLKMLFEHLKDERHLLRSSLRPQDVADIQLSALREVNGRLFLFPYEEEIEIVHYTVHSNHETIAQFLQRTKLRLEKRYQLKTVIVCYVDSYEGKELAWEAVHTDLTQFIENQNDPLHSSYTIVLICPETFNTLKYRGGIVFPYLKVSEPISILDSLGSANNLLMPAPVLRAPKGLIKDHYLCSR